jgi:hypothetical protein
MLDQLKSYLLTIGVQKYAPMAIMSGVAALGTLMMAHSGMLEQWGVTYGVWPFAWPVGQEPSGPCILIELDTLSTATIALVVATVTAIIRATQHHTTGNPGETQSTEAPKQ